MTFAIAAAGTGGHVYPGLAVGEALVETGVDRAAVLFVGGDRLESTVYPRAGFPFLRVELRGLKRSLAPSNLGLPAVVLRAIRAISAGFETRDVRAVLGLGGYVTVPAALAARRVGAPLAIAEQNAHAGLANRIASRFAKSRFASFEHTRGLGDYEWTGNPIRSDLAGFDRSRLRQAALDRYGLDPQIPVVGVFGGSLGAGAINRAVVRMVAEWSGPQVQLLQLAGSVHSEAMQAEAEQSRIPWKVVGFEDRMDYFFAASDLVVSRAGGAVAELLATGSPSVLVPGEFGSGGHQSANAAAIEAAGAAVVVVERDLDSLAQVVAGLIADRGRLQAMTAGAATLARPHAARTVAERLRALHG